MVTFNRMNNRASIEPPLNDFRSSYENDLGDEYVTHLADDSWEDSSQWVNHGSNTPVLSAREYEKELLKQAKEIRNDSVLCAEEKKLVLNQINKLVIQLRKVSDHATPPPELLSEVETLQMDMMDREAQAAEESQAQSEEIYNQLSDLRGNVESTEDSSYSLTEEQRKDTLTQIDQMTHSLDLGEKPENISKKLEELQKKLDECVVDEKTQGFINLFADSIPPVTAQDLKNAKIFDEIKNNHGEMPSDQVIQFMVDHDSTLKGLVANEDYEGAMEKIGSLLSEGFGIEVSTPDEEEAKEYGLKNQEHLLKIGSKVYAIDLSDGSFKIEKTVKMKEADLIKENIAEQLANMPGMNDTTAEDILEKADKLGFDLSNFSPSPTEEVFQFLVRISPKLQKAIESWTNTGAAGSVEAMRNALVDGLEILYGKEMVQIDTISKHCGDDIRWAGSAYDIVNNSSSVVIGNYDTYASVFRMIGGDS